MRLPQNEATAMKNEGAEEGEERKEIFSVIWVENRTLFPSCHFYSSFQHVGVCRTKRFLDTHTAVQCLIQSLKQQIGNDNLMDCWSHAIKQSLVDVIQ